MDIDLTNQIFHNEIKAIAHMEVGRWPDGVNCPLCGSVNVHRMEGKTQAGMFMCNGCRDKFTVRTSTIFERSHIPLHKWLMALHIIGASKKSVSALQLQRMLGLGSYRTAWFMCHRCREAMRPAKVGPLGGKGHVVETDETIIGGKSKNRAYAKKEPKKHTVLTMVDRDGDSHSLHIANVKAKTLRDAIVRVVDRKSHLMTDEHMSYQAFGFEFAGHTTVNPAVGFIAHAWRLSSAIAAGKVLAPAHSLGEMSRVMFNDYLDATLAALFVLVVVATVVYGVLNIRKALGTPKATAMEVEFAGAAVGGRSA